MNSISPGDRFGRLTVLYRDADSGGAGKGVFYVVKCDCGNLHRAKSSYLKRLIITHCGCLTKTIQRQMLRRHGLHGTPIYKLWTSIKNRCANPKCREFSRYGGRGITICDRWLSFDNFVADMGERPSPSHQVDRINNDGNYEPSNCQWATPKQQANNRSNNVLITHDGITRTAVQWAETTGLPRHIIYRRYQRGWRGERLFSPVDRRFSH